MHCFLLFKFPGNETKELFVSAANNSLVGTIITIGDVPIFSLYDSYNRGLLHNLKSDVLCGKKTKIFIISWLG